MNSGSKYIYADFVSQSKEAVEFPKWAKWILALELVQCALLIGFILEKVL